MKCRKPGLSPAPPAVCIDVTENELTNIAGHWQLLCDRVAWNDMPEQDPASDESEAELDTEGVDSSQTSKYLIRLQEHAQHTQQHLLGQSSAGNWDFEAKSQRLHNGLSTSSTLSKYLLSSSSISWRVGGAVVVRASYVIDNNTNYVESAPLDSQTKVILTK